MTKQTAPVGECRHDICGKEAGLQGQQRYPNAWKLNMTAENMSSQGLVEYNDATPSQKWGLKSWDLLSNRT